MKKPPRLNVKDPFRFFTVAKTVVGKRNAEIHLTSFRSTRSFCGIEIPNRGAVFEKPEKGDTCPICQVSANSRQTRENQRETKGW
jgi:hypothetical protein